MLGYLSPAVCMNASLTLRFEASCKLGHNKGNDEGVFAYLCLLVVCEKELSILPTRLSTSLFWSRAASYAGKIDSYEGE